MDVAWVAVLTLGELHPGTTAALQSILTYLHANGPEFIKGLGRAAALCDVRRHLEVLFNVVWQGAAGDEQTDPALQSHGTVGRRVAVARVFVSPLHVESLYAVRLAQAVGRGLRRIHGYDPNTHWICSVKFLACEFV